MSMQPVGLQQKRFQVDDPDRSLPHGPREACHGTLRSDYLHLLVFDRVHSRGEVGEFRCYRLTVILLSEFDPSDTGKSLIPAISEPQIFNCGQREDAVAVRNEPSAGEHHGCFIDDQSNDIERKPGITSQSRINLESHRPEMLQQGGIETESPFERNFRLARKREDSAIIEDFPLDQTGVAQLGLGGDPLKNG
jgi:hypothetical protein